MVCPNCASAMRELRAEEAYGRPLTLDISIIDPHQLETTVRELDQADARRKTVDPTLPIRLIEERLRTERAFATADPGWAVTLMRHDRSAELVQAGLRALKALLAR